MNRPTPFIICALWIYPGKDRKMRRILKDGLYYFNDSLLISDGPDGEEIIINERRIPKDWFAENISVQAVVGKNGSGKSSLLDYIYRIANNFGMSVEARIEELNRLKIDEDPMEIPLSDEEDIYPVFVADVEARLYFLECDKAGWIDCSEGRVEYNFDGVTCYVDEVNDVDRLKSMAQTFCYTIGVNYAAQAYLPSDYEQEDGLWYLRDGRKLSMEFPNSWIDGVFHKNDGYQLPICLNPYRNHGVIDMQREMNLTYSRLEALFMVLPENIKILNGYETAGTIYIFEPKYTFQAYCEADKALYDQINNYDDFGNRLISKIDESSIGKRYRPLPSRNESPYKSPWIDEIDFLTYFKDVITNQKTSIASYILSQYHVLLAEEDLPDSTWWVCAYLVKKTLSIAAIYPTYRKFRKIGRVYYFDMLLELEDERKKMLDELIEQINKDDSHITIKVKQSLNYLRDEKKREDDCKPGQVTGEIHAKVSSLERTPNLAKLQMEMLPPPFKAVVAFTKVDKDGNKKENVLLGQLSSGERQQIFTFATIAYHMFNLLSVSDDERIAYKNVNIVLDELEICFHPELQRALVSNLLTFLTGLKLNEVMAINIILSTHSPFILSDMPESNILMLEEGEKKENKDRCFGANIYDLLCNHFFMDEFIGEFALEKINEMVSIYHLESVNKGNDVSRNQRREHFLQKEKDFRLLKDMIADSYLKQDLNRMYYEMAAEYMPEKINDEIARTQQHLDELRALANRENNDR